MTRVTTTQGFSTVELLISLFVAAAFIGTAFQLFSVVMKDGNEARLRGRAGSIASSTLQERANSVNSPCSPTPATANISIPTADLPRQASSQASAQVTYSCPYGNSSKTTRVSVVVSYGVPTQQIEGSLDVTK